MQASSPKATLVRGHSNASERARSPGKRTYRERLVVEKYTLADVAAWTEHADQVGEVLRPEDCSLAGRHNEHGGGGLPLGEHMSVRVEGALLGRIGEPRDL